MARKKPSHHSVEQFAHFLARVGDDLKAGHDPAFDAAMNKLVRTANGSNYARPDGHTREARPTRLPERPDFANIEQASRTSTDEQGRLLTLIGQLVVGWSNNESLLIYILMLLLGTDERCAAVVFATLNTTRARLDLVRRLVMLRVRSAALRRVMTSIVRRLADASRTRNEFLHAMYGIDDTGRISHTLAMRFVEGRGSFSFGEREEVDAPRINLLVHACDELRVLNRDLWDVLPALQTALETPAVSGAAGASE